MGVPRPDAAAAGAQSRRAFLACCAALALSGTACAGLTPRLRGTYALLTDPPFEAYDAVLHDLIGAILPLEDPAFPVSAGEVRTRLLQLFRLEEDRRFVMMQRFLVLFDQTDLFPHPTGLHQDEQRALDPGARGDPDATIADKEAADRRLYTAFSADVPAAGARFTALDLTHQRAYLALWARSAFVVKRQFHASARSLVMIATYSMPALWPIIGYEGPLLPRGPTRGSQPFS